MPSNGTSVRQRTFCAAHRLRWRGVRDGGVTSHRNIPGSAGSGDSTMVRYGNLARLTPNEVKEFRQIGLDLSHVRHQTDIEKAVTEWAYTLADERFDLLEKSKRQPKAVLTVRV